MIESTNVETDSRCFGSNGRKRYFSEGGGGRGGTSDKI